MSETPAEGPRPGDAQFDWARTIVAALWDAGVRDLVSSPGSRSTPLVLAALDGGLRVTDVVDERAAGFYALGQARVAGVPSAVVCTSGSAAAHYLPAFVEANEAGIPLVALTANRPIDVQDLGAAQTTRQLGMLDSHAVWTADLGAPRDSAAARRLLASRVRRALAECVGRPGPIHLDAPFTKPLEPSEWPASPVDAPSGPGFSAPRAVASGAELDALAAELAGGGGVLAVGPTGLRSEPWADAVRRFCAAYGFTLIAESTSQLRDGVDATVLGRRFDRADAFDLALGHVAARRALTPRAVLQIGAAPVSRWYGEWLATLPSSTPIVVVREHGWSDPYGAATRVVRADVVATLDALVDRAPSGPAPAPNEAWRRADEAAWSGVLAAVLEDGDTLTGPSLVRTISAGLPDGGVLFVGNGLTVRDFDWFCPALPRNVGVLSQRGCAGIDGGIAGVLGAASANRGRPTTAVVGDIAFLHDVGSLQLARSGSDDPVVIVVANNRGGRIFDTLPIADLDPTGGLMPHFNTPHDVQLAPICAGFGLRSRQARSAGELAAALHDAYGHAGVTIIEALLDPEDGARARVFARVRASLDEVFA